ncbi:carboxypeptidase S1 [Pseudomassariella vexata]|uniref:Carboxypeptidase n=1 Tax=Pseudomassariella vexata TaxID=1141098 RepID=A0A1Y2EFE9_9PEZI|nr:carboxypeptidase S1 [Pseudomassariella vexata]ORY70308.1 carboxypeptidase S1 [Pseudomassariella vexata]
MRTVIQRAATLSLLTALISPSLAAPTTAHLDKRYVEERGGITYNVFEHRSTGSKMSFVKNSGICETTPGVNQYSGYLSVGDAMNMWFWFFEARENPKEAPLATWFNGGPGCSSMIGLFQENGPCHFVNNQSTPSLNPYSFNNYANVLYVDQPIGTGFSYGIDDVNSTVTAAPFVWNLLQAFYAHFPEYECRDFGIFTESYGGHYGPEFAHYIQEQNAAIEEGDLEGDKINIVAVGINNGWFDSTIQERAYIDYALNNSYRPLINESVADSLYDIYETKCVPALNECISSGTDEACSYADDTCIGNVDTVIYDSADFGTYDIRVSANTTDPPETYVDYLQRPDVMKAIGAQVTYAECPDAPYYKFAATGDDARSFLETLTKVVQTGISVLLWAGDADFICNWIGNYQVAEAVVYSAQSNFTAAEMVPYTVNGTEKGLFKTADNLSFLKVYEAGHEVPYYQPEVALQAFKQTMMDVAIAST